MTLKQWRPFIIIFLLVLIVVALAIGLYITHRVDFQVVTRTSSFDNVSIQCQYNGARPLFVDADITLVYKYKLSPTSFDSEKVSVDLSLFDTDTSIEHFIYYGGYFSIDINQRNPITSIKIYANDILVGYWSGVV